MKNNTTIEIQLTKHVRRTHSEFILFFFYHHSKLYYNYWSTNLLATVRDRRWSLYNNILIHIINSNLLYLKQCVRIGR